MSCSNGTVRLRRRTVQSEFYACVELNSRNLNKSFLLRKGPEDVCSFPFIHQHTCSILCKRIPADDHILISTLIHAVGKKNFTIHPKPLQPSSYELIRMFSLAQMDSFSICGLGRIIHVAHVSHLTICRELRRRSVTRQAQTNLSFTTDQYA